MEKKEVDRWTKKKKKSALIMHLFQHIPNMFCVNRRKNRQI